MVAVPLVSRLKCQICSLPFWLNTDIAKVMLKAELVFYLVAAGEWKYLRVHENIEKAIKVNTERTEARYKKKEIRC